MPETALTSGASFLMYLWHGNYWKISTQIRLVAQLAVFQLFDDAFYNYRAGLVRLGLLVPFLLMNGGLQNVLIIFALVFASALIVWKKNGARSKWMEYSANTICLFAALWLFPVPALASCLVGLVTFVDYFARAKPTINTMKLTKVILCGGICISLALIFWWRKYGL